MYWITFVFQNVRLFLFRRIHTQNNNKKCLCIQLFIAILTSESDWLNKKKTNVFFFFNFKSAHNLFQFRFWMDQTGSGNIEMIWVRFVLLLFVFKKCSTISFYILIRVFPEFHYIVNIYIYLYIFSYAVIFKQVLVWLTWSSLPSIILYKRE